MDAEITVLCVDDDPDYLELLESHLQSDGRDFDVVSTDEPLQCLKMLENGDGVDCVVSDYQMPDIDGLELLDRVRDTRADVPFLLYTAEGTEEVASDAIAAGVDDYVPKTTGTEGFDLLAKRIENAVEQRRAEAAYQEVFDRAAVGLVIHDAETGETVAVNERFRETMGYDEDEEVDVRELFLDEEPYSWERAREHLKETVEEGGSRTMEWRNETVDAEDIWVDVELEPAEINGVRRVIASVTEVTDRKQRKRERRRQRDLLERTQEIADVGGWELDVQTGELRWTEELYRIRGVDEDVEPSLEMAYDLYHPDDRDDIVEAVDQALKNREPYDLELRMETPDDETKWVRVRGERQSEGGREYLRGTMQDVTERKRRERRYDAIFNNTFGFTVLLSPDGRVLEVNDTALSFGGVSREDVVDRRIWETPWISYDADVARFAEEAVSTASEGEFLRRELEVQGAERKAVVDTSIRPVTDKSDEVVLLVVEGREITRRKQREEELEKTKERLRSIFDGSPDAVYIHDEEGRFLDVNTTACERLGYSREELLEMSIADVAPDVRGDLVERTFSDPDFTGTTMQVQHQRKDGTTFPVQVNVTRAELSGGDQFVAVVRDVTEMKESERRLRRQRDRMEEFAEIVSHDLRNPLTVARGRLQMAMEDADVDYLDDVERAHDRMEEVIDDMLDLARKGDYVEELEEGWLKREAEMAWYNVSTREASLEVVDDGMLDADLNRLSRMFENLYANAVEHGSGRDDAADLTVRVGLLEDGFYVEDDGEGVSPEEAERAFEPGYSTSETGSGLGLMVVHDIAEAHGWDVELQSSGSGGARFEVTGVDYESS